MWILVGEMVVAPKSLSASYRLEVVVIGCSVENVRLIGRLASVRSEFEPGAHTKHGFSWDRGHVHTLVQRVRSLILSVCVCVGRFKPPTIRRSNHLLNQRRKLEEIGKREEWVCGTCL